MFYLIKFMNSFMFKCWQLRMLHRYVPFDGIYSGSDVFGVTWLHFLRITSPFVLPMISLIKWWWFYTQFLRVRIYYPRTNPYFVCYWKHSGMLEYKWPWPPNCFFTQVNTLQVCILKMIVSSHEYSMGFHPQNLGFKNNDDVTWLSS